MIVNITILLNNCVFEHVSKISLRGCCHMADGSLYSTFYTVPLIRI